MTRSFCLSEEGKLSEKYWREIPGHFSNVILDEYIIMPNHMHGIITIDSGCRDAIHRVSANHELNILHKDEINSEGLNGIPVNSEMNNMDTMDGKAINRDAMNRVSTGGITGIHNPMLNKNSLSHILRWFKGRSSFEIKKINNGFAWQSRFHDHIIRDQKSFLNIQDYIKENPIKWDKDKYNPKNKKLT